MVDDVVDLAILGISIIATLLGVTGLVAGEVFAFAALLIGILGLVYLKTGFELISEQTGSQSSSDAAAEEDPLTILRERYARGEITQEEFERRLDDLLETETLEQAAQHHEKTRMRERE